MGHGIICEPVDVRPETLLLSEHVEQTEEAEALEPFHHFHDVCELVWFRSGIGEVLTESGTFTISGGTAIFLPAMHSHDFSIAAGEKEWVLFHIDPSLVATLIQEDALPALETVLCCRFEGTARTRIDTLLDWASDVSSDPIANRPLLTRLIKLVLGEMTRSASIAPRDITRDVGKFERLRPALDLVAQQTSHTVSLEDAASACHLSEAYFSRRFKSVFGMNFSDYVRTYRLRLAARRLIVSGERISDIAFSLGFATPAHFTALFQNRFGMTPRDYRSMAQGHEAIL
ncbi:MAG: AraC family transcriptional regulator [Henriciella sp.]|nr:AraC family transcriptional regulator [Henriciella sp.]